MAQTLQAHLLQQGLVSHTVGAVPKQPKLAIVIWAKHPPRLDNAPLITLATIIGNQKPTIYVDDTAARVFCGRTVQEQEFFNNQYRAYGQQHGCPMFFSSELYAQYFGDDVLGALFELAARTSVSRFMRCLPEKKTTIFDTLPSSETMNMLLELLLFEQVSRGCNALVVRHFTQGIVLSHQKVSAKPLPAFVVPKLEDDAAIYGYVAKARKLYPDAVHPANTTVL